MKSLVLHRVSSPILSAIRTPAVAATDNGLLAPEPAAGIARVKSAKSMGVRSGKWLTLRQAQALLNAPDITTTQGLRDHAIIVVLLAVQKTGEVVR
jgi:site-specific recombinase XerD